jgi:CheY-like chemotaxis protein
MNAILGFSQLMQRDPTLPPHQRQHLDIINRSGEQLLLLIDDILNMAKIEAGRATLSPTTFDLPALLDNLEMAYRMLTDAKHLQLLMERGADLPRYVVTDEDKLRQALSNLLGNAVKFTEEGGVALRVSVPRSDSGLRLVAEVEDSGAGIAEEELGKLFQPFEQTSAGVRTLKGTGLGLAISQEFAHLMGGTITVSSTAGKGSIFRLEIGLEEGVAAAVAQKEVLRPVTGQQPGQPLYRLLVVDDNEDNRTLLERMLAAVGFEVRGAVDGEDAIRAFEARHPDLILMDMRMPVMDGFEAIRRIRASAGGETLPIIVVTASPVLERRQEALEVGASDFLSKPFREAELFAKIQSLLGVEYTYAEDALEVPASGEDSTAGELTTEAVAVLPAQLINELHAATIDADRDRLLELIGVAESHDAQVGQGLRRLAQRFDYQSLLSLLQNGGRE